MNVLQLMTRNVKSCQASENLASAAKLMWEEDIGCVPILSDDGNVIGMLTDRDIAMAGYTQGKPISEISIGSVMSREIHSCLETDTVIHAEETMRRHQVRRLPVVDAKGQLTGIISLNDLARQAETEQGRQRRQVSQQEVAATLAEISHPRVPREMVRST